MPRKGSSGPPKERTDEESWQPSGSEGPLQGTLDVGVELERDNEYEEVDLIYGDIVHDRDAEDPEHAVVMNLPNETADDWDVGDDKTLADQNPGYPREDDVVIVVNEEELDDYLPEWDERDEEIPLDQLDEDEIPYEAFPSLRLVLIEPSHLRD